MEAKPVYAIPQSNPIESSGALSDSTMLENGLFLPLLGGVFALMLTSDLTFSPVSPSFAAAIARLPLGDDGIPVKA